MALETNARIPSPYVYKPVDFGGKIDAEAANKAAALKAGIQAKKDLKTKNDAALAVKPTWTTEGVLNGAIENKANQIRDTYSKMAAAGIPIWDATTPEGSAFAEEIAGLNKFSNEMKGYEQNINEIEAVKGADNDAYNYYVGKIGEAKDPAAVDAVVTSYRENKDLLAKAPDLPKAVAATVNATAKNKDIVDIGKLNKFDKITIKSSIPDEKVQDVFEVAKNSEASKLEEKLYDFKQKNGILDPEFDKFNSYDEYLMDQVKDQIALTASENDQLRSQWQINISNNAGGTKTTGGGNPIYVRPGDANKQFQALDRTKQLDKGNTKYLAISVDPSVLSNLQQSADMILDEGGARYVKLDELWQFPDKESKGAVQDISWVWTDKAKAQQGAWSPKEGNYKTPSGLDVNGKPVEVLWDQDGNAWATIETTKGDKVRVLIYDTEENVFGVGSPATNSIKGNAQAFLGTFTDAGALKPGVLNNTRASIANIFDKTEGLIPGEVE
jgi:hypothetical protein